MSEINALKKWLLSNQHGRFVISGQEVKKRIVRAVNDRPGSKIMREMTNEDWHMFYALDLSD